MRSYGLPKEWVTDIAEDSEGGIWAVTNNGLPLDEIKPGAEDHYRGGVYRYINGHVEKLFAGGSENVVSVAPGVMLVTPQTDRKDDLNDLYRFRKEKTGWKAERLLARDAGELTLSYELSPPTACFFQQVAVCHVFWPHGHFLPRGPKRDHLVPDLYPGKTGSPRCSTRRLGRGGDTSRSLRSSRVSSFSVPFLSQP